MSEDTGSALDDRAKVIAISLDLQQIATDVRDRLRAATGEDLAFVLVVSVGKVAQYISNAERGDGMRLLEHVRRNWENKRADIPAHYNPDLNLERPQ